jgi:ferredoxin
MADPVYEQLAGALNARSTAFPSVKCKEFFDLVEFLFTPEEAKIAVAMPLGNASIEAIAANLDTRDLKKLEAQLEGMADHGLINIREKDGRKLYEGLPFVPGITEYQLMRGIIDERHKKIAVLLRDYARAMIKTLMSPDAPKIESFAPAKDGKRVPVDHDIPHTTTVVPLEEIKDLVRKTEYVAAGTCICRHQGILLGKECKEPTNNCMILGETAKFSSERGFTKILTTEEALKRLDEADEAGLIHSFANTPDSFTNLLCNCCQCHCMIMRGVKRSPAPSKAVNARYLIKIDDDACTACEACIPRCQMEALKMVDGKLVRDENRCIGCGICMWVCPTDALSLDPLPASNVPLKA